MAPKKGKKIEPFIYEVSRYQPRIKSILQDSIGGVLDSSAFTAVKGGVGTATSSASANASNTAGTAPVSLRHKATTAPTTHSASSSAASASVPSRSVIVFMIGGMTYSEIRATYEVAELTKREIYIGNWKSQKRKESNLN